MSFSGEDAEQLIEEFEYNDSSLPILPDPKSGDIYGTTWYNLSEEQSMELEDQAYAELQDVDDEDSPFFSPTLSQTMDSQPAPSYNPAFVQDKPELECQATTGTFLMQATVGDTQVEGNAQRRALKRPRREVD